MGRLFLLVVLVCPMGGPLVAMPHSNPEETERRVALIKRTMPAENKQMVLQRKEAERNMAAAIYIMRYDLNPAVNADDEHATGHLLDDSKK